MPRTEVTGEKPRVSAYRINRRSGPPDDNPTQHGEPDARVGEPKPPLPRLAFNIPEFCSAYRISPDFYYKLKRRGEGPREMKIGSRTVISIAAADEWRVQREADTAAEAAKRKAAREREAANNAEAATT